MVSTSYKDSMMVLTTTMCSNMRRKADGPGFEGCYFCAYFADDEHIRRTRPSVEEMVKQTESFMAERDEAIRRNGDLYIVNSGSFFSSQVPREYMRWLAGQLNGSGLGLHVDARADSPMEEYSLEIGELVKATSSMTVCMGLEVADDVVLEQLNKRCTKRQYVDASAKIHSFGARTKAYVLAGTPFLRQEEPFKGREYADLAIRSAFETMKFAVEEMGVSELGLQALFPYLGTPLKEGLFDRDLWVPVSPTEFAEVVNQAAQAFPAVRVVGTNRQVQWPYFRKADDPIYASDGQRVLAARENVARICEQVVGRRGRISRRVSGAKQGSK